MKYDHLPRVSLAHLPTRLEPMARLGAELGVDLWVKRDDCTGLALGGNKTRKLEFTMGEALAKGADAIVTCGGYQSNHVRQTAAAAARLGLEFHAVISAPPPDRRAHYFASGNLLLDRLVGAELHVADDDGPATEAKAAELMDGLRAKGRTPFFVPLGASDATGSVGYAVCAEELLAQCEAQRFEPRWIVLVTGSAGTHAGMLTGLRALGSDASVVGVSSSEPAEVKRAKVRAIVDPLVARLGLSIAVPDEDIEVSDAYVGEGYAIPTPEANAAITRTAAREALLLDPVYTGKGMAGLIDLAGQGRFGADEPVVFLHTGGAPALFVYEEQFWDGVAS